ncbi:TIGR02302 family protein [Niveispirillum sp. BGYR6]|uniref:TIGR02302 family protein n=1 Tax=Niveispirillum sp. BGYR6 TaxID=2971249 RepID=UPI0022B9B63C|nr:TIGR02302 family protein [Niveispirillum sp. BGYR6]MDG5497663.1 TIGR02302 family protein [Niveispirillum sp. BGYR6]
MDRRPEEKKAASITRTPAKAPRDPAARRLRLARLVLDAEALWRGLWRPLTAGGLFLALAWMGLFIAMPAWLHAMMLLGTLGGIGWLGWRDLRGFRPATVEEARRRLEQDSALPHRPLTQLNDGIAGGAGDPLAHALWRAAQERARKQAAHTKLGAPRPVVTARDPWGLRAIPVLLLAVGATLGWGELGSRFTSALLPSVGLSQIGVPTTLDAWVKPPDYTGQPPIFLTRQKPADGGEPGPVALPQGSTFTARLTGGYGTPKLKVNGEEVPFQPVAGGGWQVEQAVREGERIAIRQAGREVAGWDIQVVPDTGPGIAFRTPPSVTERQAVRLDYTAADDYGITSVTATATLDSDDIAPTIDRTPIDITLPVPARNKREVSGVAYEDLTGHPWAGLPVQIRLRAQDGAGQTGQSSERKLVLPERVFNHPVARAIIDQRKALIQAGDAARPMAARELNEISARPGAYNGDPVAFMGLRAAIARLMLNQSPGALPSTVALLWDVALRIEDGGVALSERDLRSAQQELMEALDRNASDAEVEQAMQRLEQAMQQFMDALERQALEQARNGQPPPQAQAPTDPNTQVMSREDVERMVQQMRDMARAGGREAAREMLSQLQQMMENLQNGAPPPPPQTAEDAARQQAMQQLSQKLQDVQRQQRELLDETFRQAQEAAPPEQNMQMPGFGLPNRQGRRPSPQQGEQGQPGGQPPGQGAQGQGQGAGDAAARQQALRQQLGEVMRQLGEMGNGQIPQSLGDAERAMREAQQALGQGNAAQAIPSQNQALQQLQETLQAMQQQMANQQGQSGGQRTQTGRQQGRDPLGRPLPGNGNMGGEDVKIPTQGDVQRAREILEELRRRAGEQNRPKQERDYIDRLLNRFNGG